MYIQATCTSMKRNERKNTKIYDKTITIIVRSQLSGHSAITEGAINSCFFQGWVGGVSNG